MILNMSALPPPLRYQWMTQAVIPRPVAWLLSQNAGGNYNLAPFSYFNALSSAPPLVGVSFGQKDLPPASDNTSETAAQKADKDTLINIRARPLFVIHIAAMSQLPQLNQTAASLPYGTSEIAQQQLPLVPFINNETSETNDPFPLPRLADAPLALACRLHSTHALGESQTLAIGEILYLYASESVLSADAKNRPLIDAKKVDPVARLSAGQYAGLSNITLLKRPA